MINDIENRTECKNRHALFGDKRWFDLRFLLNKVEVQLTAVAHSRGKIIGVNMPEKMSSSYFGNPSCLNDMFNNLASYSLFYLDDEGIFFNVHADILQHGKIHLVIVATTIGLGIPHYKIRNVFQPVSQEGCNGNSSLYVSKTLAALMGGDVTIENTFGWGTRYTINVVLGDAIAASPSGEQLPDQMSSWSDNQ